MMYRCHGDKPVWGSGCAAPARRAGDRTRCGPVRFTWFYVPRSRRPVRPATLHQHGNPPNTRCQAGHPADAKVPTTHTVCHTVFSLKTYPPVYNGDIVYQHPWPEVDTCRLLMTWQHCHHPLHHPHLNQVKKENCKHVPWNVHFNKHVVVCARPFLFLPGVPSATTSSGGDWLVATVRHDNDTGILTLMIEM